MSNIQRYVLILVFSIICTSNAININVIPEYLNDNHFAHVEKCEIPCEYFEKHGNPDAELYIAMNNKDVQSAVHRNPKVPIRILGSQEPQHYYHLLKLEYLNLRFHGSSLLDRKSDIPWVLMSDMDKLMDVNISKDAQPKATFVARNCNAMNNRNDYVKAIDAKIGVLALGSCLNNAEWPDCSGRPCSKVEAIRPYKINLAFENGDSPGLVTEKIYHAFEAGVLPVWMGTRDVAEAVPRGSYIDVAEFNTPDDVASYLQLVLENKALYNSYFEWKYKPFDPEYVRNNKVLWSEPAFCRMCYYVDTLQRGLEWDHLRQRAANDNTTIINIRRNNRLKIILHENIHIPEHTSEENVTLYWLLLFPITCIVLLMVFRRRSCFRAIQYRTFM